MAAPHCHKFEQTAQLRPGTVGPVRWERRYRFEARCLVRPHQQHGTRGVVDDEASDVAQAVRTKTRTITISGHNQEIDVLGDDAEDFALHPSPTMNKLRVLTSEPPCRGFEDLQGLLIRHLVELADGAVRPKGPTEQSGACHVADLTDLGGRDVEERDLRAGGNDLSGGVETPLPCSLDQPDDGPHWLNHPTSFKDTHKATVEATSTGGTVTTPRRRNSEVDSSSPRCRRTRRQSRVASDPT